MGAIFPEKEFVQFQSLVQDRRELGRPRAQRSALSGNTNLVHEEYHDNESLIQEFGISENKNEMKQVRVVGAEAYGNKCKQLVMVRGVRGQGFRGGVACNGNDGRGRENL